MTSDQQAVPAAGDGPGREDRRVVVVALGAVTSHGVGADLLWKGVSAGQVAITEVRGRSMEGYGTTLGGQVLPYPEAGYDYVAGLGATEREPAVDLALTAAEEAMAPHGLLGLAPERWGVALGSCNGGTVSGERVLRRAHTDDARPGDARQLLLVSPHGIAEILADAFGLKGPVVSVNTACASGAHAVAHALETIRAGRADAMLVGGTDAFTETAFAGFSSLESLSRTPAAPYSRDRDGLSLGEGSGMLVLVEESVARAAGATVLADVLGYGLSSDGHHATAPHPDGEGAARAIRAALDTSGLTADDVSYINGHGTGTPKNDSAESNAVRAALGASARNVALSSTKSMIGHLLGAAGAVEAITTIAALREQTAPPTAGFTAPDPRCGLDAVPGRARPRVMDTALSNNFAFAGANATLALGRPGVPRPNRPTAPWDERVVITAVGALTAAGDSADALWEAYGNGAGEPQEDAGALRYAFPAKDHLSPRERRRVDRLGQLAIASCRKALGEAGLEAGPRVGVVLGSGLGPLRSIEDFFRPVMEEGPAAASPAHFPNTVFNAAAGQIAMVLGAKGPTSTATAAHAAGASALCIARDMLRTGTADAVLCPAVDDLTDTVIDAYRRLPLIGGPAGRRFRLTEGAITLLLERESHARARGAHVLAEITGHGAAYDAVGAGRWDPRGAGQHRAMRLALADAGLEPGELTGVWANAVGVAAVDRPEERALARLGADAPVHAPKRVIGEPVGAGAHLNAVLALTGWSRGLPAGPVLVNSSSLGGTHISLVLRPERRS
ncbi:beta-ketoacyl-[acyl-carrier-protein] synthase family protein [Streptomyces sp. NPDC002262]|uniref:beta-ketoacyl-[acyl-carrier-protein] synthase family protein n=1 Tax=unclassified Streptomyces TaxID=2593676 RepID=UPI00331A6F35